MGLLSAYLYNFKVLCDFPFGASQVLIPTYIPTKMQAASGLLWTIQTTAQEYFTIKIIYYGKIKTTVNLNPLLHDGITEVHLPIFRAIDVAVGIGQAGKGLAEVGLRVPELFREGFRLFLQVTTGNPAGGGKSRLNGGAGLFIQFGMQSQRHAFFQSQGLADNGGGELEQPLVRQRWNWPRPKRA